MSDEVNEPSLSTPILDRRNLLFKRTDCERPCELVIYYVQVLENKFDSITN